ncbi:ABC transporter substrate-binding protein [Tardiphaga sp. 866_E4_N2_1]|uniref:ABC transporter substrate-binding protein n=1 Tax=unclassified Tardiphaga TaxID=2631404 RepID=UPI003F2295C0
MTDTAPLSVATWRYDRTQAIYDGRVGLKSRSVELIDLPLEEIFARAFTTGEFDVSELSFSNYLRLTVAGKCPYVGVPVFPSRSFRHGTFYVRTDANISGPEDLRGRRIGVREFSMTAALAARGALRDQFGVGSEELRWVVGDVDEKERDAIELPKLYRDIDLTVAPEGKLLSNMLLAGEIDAVLAYKPIKPFKSGDGRVARLFQDTRVVEEAYFKETRIFPIMHLMAVRRDLAVAEPGILREVFDAFAEAQSMAMEDLHLEQALKVSLPWLGREVKRTIDVMGHDFWPNGFKANRAVVERMIEWSFRDGMIPQQIAPEELFARELLDT